VMQNEFDKRRKFLVEGLNSVEGVACITPNGAFYAFPNMSKLYGKKASERQINGSLDLATYLLEDAKVALVHGDAFGDDNYIRISYATSMENIKKGLERIREAVTRLA